MYFRFEEDFVEGNIRCIPMIVRFKLDACGIKLKLAEWSRMTPAEREQFSIADCNTSQRIVQYKEDLRRLIIDRTGNLVAEIAVDDNPEWSRVNEIPFSIQEKLAEGPWSISLDQWHALSDLQRFVLLKLSSPGHENRNFPRAMAEFGLLPEGSD